LEKNKGGTNHSDKIYKIKYVFNLLPVTVNKNTEDGTLSEMMEYLCDTEELDLFYTDAIKIFFTYNWDMYGKHL